MSEYQSIKKIMEIYTPRPMLGKPFSPQIRPGIYNVDNPIEESESPNPISLDMSSDEILIFRDENINALKREIKNFWESEELFRSRNLLHKRGLLVVGPTGSGKSSLLKVEMLDLVKKGQVVFIANSPYGLKESLHRFRRMEPARELTVILEDVDEMVRGYGEQQLLQILDGPDSIDHVLFIGTTNNPEKMSTKLRRAGRFDRRLNVPYPSLEQRFEYLVKKEGERISEERLNKVAKYTEGFSFPHLKEILVSVFGHGEKLSETIKRMRKELEEEDKKDTRNDDAFVFYKSF